MNQKYFACVCVTILVIPIYYILYCDNGMPERKNILLKVYANINSMLNKKMPIKIQHNQSEIKYINEIVNTMPTKDKCKRSKEAVERGALLSLSYINRKLKTPVKVKHMRQASALALNEWNDLFSLKTMDKPAKQIQCKDPLGLFNESTFSQLTLFYIDITEGEPILYKNTSTFLHLDLDENKIACTYSYIGGEQRVPLNINVIKLNNSHNALGIECKVKYSEIHHLSKEKNSKDRDPLVFYRDIFMFPNFTRKTKEKIKKENYNSSMYSVLILVLDSVSTFSFLRNLPITAKYMEDHGGVLFKKHHRLGENSYPNVVTFLTGRKTPIEKPNYFADEGVMEDISDKNNVTWAWEFWKEKGFPTMYQEDMQFYSVFHYNTRKGWRSNPISHYYRPAYQAMMSKRWNVRNSPIMMSRHSFKCINNSPTHIRQLDLMEKFARSFEDVPYFSFNHISEYTHGTDNFIAGIDKCLALTLKWMEWDGILNRTLLILMGDHGRRFGPLMKMEAGLLEGNSPFLIIRPPDRIIKSFPSIKQALLTNQDKVTTMQDIHKTITDPLITGMNIQHTHPGGLSLLRTIPSRSCNEAQVPQIFCTCATVQMNVNTSDPKLVDNAGKVITMINGLIKNNTKCQKLFFQGIDWGTVEGDLFTLHVVTYLSNNKVYLPTFHVRFRKNQLEKVTFERKDRYDLTSLCLKKESEYKMRPFCICTNLK